VTTQPDRRAQLPRTKVRAKLHSYDSGDREIVLLEGARGSRLIVDRSIPTTDDARLLAHLAADEPDTNAMLVVADYLAGSRRCCRALRLADLLSFAEGTSPTPPPAHPPHTAVLADAMGYRYRLAATGVPAELRWLRESRYGPAVVSAREVVAALEDYDPVLALTRTAVSALRNNRSVSIATLALELRRLEASPIVLNRRLREAVLDAVQDRGVSMSAIAIACGRMKRDQRGKGSGETSWLARRVGLIPDGTTSSHNPWVHSDTLALVARDGLGIAPREVELG
jgi:hypothetical protein